MQSVLSEIQNVFLRSKIRNGDGIDQLHHMVTVFVLTAFAAVIVVLEYVGKPINCWTYGENAGEHQEHVNQYCWTHSLYHYPDLSNRSVMPYALNQMGGPEVVQLKEEASGRITFYRWGTAIFLFQALMFKLPSLLWGEYSSYFGCNIVKMVEVMQEMVFDENREKKLREVARFLHKWLGIYRRNNKYKNTGQFCKEKWSALCTGTLCVGDKMSNKLPFAYLLTKLGFLANNLFQFYFLSAFLVINFWTYGVETIESHAFSEEVPESSSSKAYFPTLAICHFRTYDQGTSAAHPVAKGKWVQCILRVNIIMEKMFLVEWFWLLGLLGLTIVSIGYWCYSILSNEDTRHYVERLTKRMEQDPETDVRKEKNGQTTDDECKNENGQKTVDECKNENGPKKGGKVLTKEEGDDFIADYLCNDGVFILRILAINTNEVIVAELLETMLDMYLEEKKSDNTVGTDKKSKKKKNTGKLGFNYVTCETIEEALVPLQRSNV